jgi:hypothetical protein
MRPDQRKLPTRKSRPVTRAADFDLADLISDSDDEPYTLRAARPQGFAHRLRPSTKMLRLGQLIGFGGLPSRGGGDGSR